MSPFPPTRTAELSPEWPGQFTILLGMSHFALPTWRLLSCLTKLHQSFQGRILVVGLTRLARIRPTCLALTARQSNRARDQRVVDILRAWHVSTNNRHDYHVKRTGNNTRLLCNVCLVDIGSVPCCCIEFSL